MARGSGASKKKGRKKAVDKPSSDNESKDGSDRPPKFKFECQECGVCCGSETIYVYFTDLDRWIDNGTIYRIMHLLDIEESEGQLRLFLRKDDDGFCNLYHRDTKHCTIYDARPMYCRAYPLGYNGENYYLKSRDCAGIGKGKMTKEKLEIIRNDAFEEYLAFRLTEKVFPVVQSVLLNKLLRQSKEFMEKAANENIESNTEDDEQNSGEQEP